MKEKEPKDLWDETDELEYQLAFDKPAFKRSLRWGLAEDIDAGIITREEAKKIEKKYNTDAIRKAQENESKI